MKTNPLTEKSLNFAAKAVKFCIDVHKQTNESVITKQLIRSSTSIGANINEANFGVSKADFISKMQISMKEAAESEYWLRLLYKADYVTEDEVKELIDLCEELERMLVATLKTAKSNR